MEDLLPVLRGVLSPAGAEILRASARCILRRYPKLPRLPGIEAEVNVPPERSGAGHVLGELEDHCLKYDEPLRV